MFLGQSISAKKTAAQPRRTREAWVLVADDAWTLLERQECPRASLLQPWAPRHHRCKFMQISLIQGARLELGQRLGLSNLFMGPYCLAKISRDVDVYFRLLMVTVGHTPVAPILPEQSSGDGRCPGDLVVTRAVNETPPSESSKLWGGWGHGAILVECTRSTM